MKRQDNGEWYVDAKGGTEITTGKDGKFVLRYLPAGDYILTEQLPTGYADVKPTGITIGQDNGMEKPVEVEAHNLPTKLIFEKLDALSGKPMLALAASNGGAAEAASFRLLNDKGEVVKLGALESGALRPSSDGKEYFAVDANGLREILYLPVGSYTIEEVSAATGYGVATPIKVEIKGENSTEKPAKAQMKDDPLALRIQKEKKGGGSLSGAGFTLTAKGSDKALGFSLVDGKYHYATDGKETVLMVDSQGVTLVYYLPVGEYTVTETVTPEGYFNAHPVTVKISSDNTTAKPAEIRVINEPEVKLGLDNDRWRVAGAIALIAIALGGAAAIVIMIRKKQLLEDGTHGS